ncbi:MAG: flippase-like domain-containing protein [Planctomycetes bacterium]|nr:flippase-like domain-containing protein [Planctomycetota bacterium]
MIGHLSRATWFRVVVSAAILAYLVLTIDVGAAIGAVARLSGWYLAGALGLVLIDRLLMISRWTLLLKGTGTAIRFKSAAWIFLVSSYVGSFMPAGIGGDAARAWTLAKRTADGGGAVASVAIDRLLGVIAVVLLGAVGAAAWMQHDVGASALWFVILGCVVVAAAVAMLWSDRIYERIVPLAWRTGWIGSLGRLTQAVGVYRRVPRTLLAVLALSVVVQAARVLQAAVLAAGLGLSVPLGYFFVFMPIGLLLLQVPISVGGFGAPQGVIVWLLERRGVSEPASLALSTLIILLGIAGTLPGAWLFFRGRRSQAARRD